MYTTLNLGFNKHIRNFSMALLRLLRHNRDIREQITSLQVPRPESRHQLKHHRIRLWLNRRQGRRRVPLGTRLLAVR